MAWNEPGGSGDKDKNRDPWSNRPNSSGGPPDLDEIFKNLRKKLTGLLSGRGRGGSGGGGHRSSGGGNEMTRTFLPLAVFLLVIWLVYDCTYFVKEAERGIVTRFGRYVGMQTSGINFQFPRPIDSVEKVDVSQVQRIPMQAQLLTKDLNLIRISLVVQYKINDKEMFDEAYLAQTKQLSCPISAGEAGSAIPVISTLNRNYITDNVFAVKDPHSSLSESTESALREVVGGTTMDDILSEGEGREKLVNAIKEQIQKTIDKYRTGYLVTKVNLEKLQPPDEVQKAFQDAVSAKENQETLHKKAEAYTRDLIPKAEGDAERSIQEASAYREQVIRKAEGETQRFLQNLTEYHKAPQITRKRMYLETMEYLLSKSSKVLVKVSKGNNVMYLPIDKFMNKNATASTNNENKTSTDSTPLTPSGTDSTRGTEGRIR
ncbi:MAG: FtsH protease activity modulator HflK [Gammaproteobacteria bacterium]|nr:FtsH protease activity modulator HflK [Gammaproteobacteria bacterium]